MFVCVLQCAIFYHNWSMFVRCSHLIIFWSCVAITLMTTQANQLNYPISRCFVNTSIWNKYNGKYIKSWSKLSEPNCSHDHLSALFSCVLGSYSVQDNTVCYFLACKVNHSLHCPLIKWNFKFIFFTNWLCLVCHSAIQFKYQCCALFFVTTISYIGCVHSGWLHMYNMHPTTQCQALLFFYVFL